MWILESSSELFQGRRMWLKPGKSYLFGRVQNDGVRFAIEHKTISRKHFIIRVEDVDVDDIGNIHARTKVTIEDQNSKAGTTVNGEYIKGSSKELKNKENYIKPGSLPSDLVLRWHPFVLTYNLLKKEVKAGLLRPKQERVRDLDIKAVSEYITGQTTHLVVNKRNTPKSLQALIEGRPLVAESYIDALEYAATPADLNEEENLSPLEQDFDGAWPNAFDHLPPPGRELTTRPAESYKPDPGRSNVFENLTFVFVDQTQYDNLLPPITTGHGKALLYKIVVNETTVEELITYLRNAAGHKKFGNPRKDVDKGGVILVRYKGDTGAEDWTNTLMNKTSLRLDQRAIDQGEFLDAILANDGMLLRQSVPFENNSNMEVAPASAVSVARISQSADDSITEPDAGIRHRKVSPPPAKLQSAFRSQSSNHDQNMSLRNTSQPTQVSQSLQSRPVNMNSQEPPEERKRFMVPKKSRVFDFDDDFDPSKVVPWHGDDDDEDSVPQTSQTHLQSTTSQQRDIEDTVKDEPLSSRKRQRFTNNGNSLDDDLDDLLPAAALMKRRKLAHQSRENPSPEPIKNKPLNALFKEPKKPREIDVLKEVKAQRQAEERTKKEYEDEEDVIQFEPGEQIPVYDVETVLIDLPARRVAGQELSNPESDRWDPKWNGRKNFKAFRRAKDGLNGQGDNNNNRRRNTNKVIVPLVDTKTSTYGMGDQYWDKTAEEKQREREKKQRASQRTTQTQSDQSRNIRQQRSPSIASDGEGSGNTPTTNGHTVHASPELSRLQNEAAEIMEHDINIDEPRQTRSSDTQLYPDTTIQTSTATKRPTSGPSRGGAAKRQKTMPVTVVHGSDSDDSDDMKFKFGSRRRGRGRT